MSQDNEEYAILWDFISSDKDLTYAEKILYSIILSLSMTEGYCWATNLQLMERMGISPGSQRAFQDFLTGLKEKNWIIVEGGTRDRKIYPLKKRIIAENQLQSNSVKKDIIAEKPHNIIAENQPESPTPPYKEKLNSILKVKHIEARAKVSEEKVKWGKPMLCSNTSPKKTKKGVEMEKKEKPKKSPFSQAVLTSYGYYQLPPMMTGTPPTPGCAKMVSEVRDLLSNQIHIGSRSYKMAEEDKALFFGYSPFVIEAAIARTHHTSKTGNPIRNVVAAIFKSCGDIRREGKKDSGPEFSMHYR